MVDSLWPANASSGNPVYGGRILRQTTVAPFVAGATQSRPLGALSGVRPGGAPTATVTSATVITVGAFAGVIDGESANEAGPYSFAFDAAHAVNISAADASNPRLDIISVQVSDPNEGDSTSAPGIALVYTAGTAAATPAQPATPARSFPVIQVSVPKVGSGSPTATVIARSLAGPGGKVNVPTVALLNTIVGWKGAEALVTDETTISLLNGNYRWHVPSQVWFKTGLLTSQGSQSSAVTIGTNNTLALSQTVNVVAGAFYRVHGYVLGTQVTTAGTPTVIIDADGNELSRLLSGIGSVGVGQVGVLGDASPIFRATSTRTVVFSVSGSTTAGTFRSFPLLDVECMG